MGLSIVVNLYTVRVIWQVLGIDDYGIYNLVGGIVLMFQFLNAAMVASSQRFISFQLGKKNLENLKKVFSISVTVHYLLAGVILLLAETIGLWFLNSKLNIPEGRMFAANWVFQCSLLALLISVISVPYNACIVAHEHMKAYGYIGILEVLLKLAIVFLLMVIPFDKLITYAILILFVQVTIRIIYQSYCRRNFVECQYKYVREPHLMRDMFSFAGWSFLGNLGFSVRDQGLNIILNMFYNVAMNAARGIALQVTGVISGFASNFQMALNPQITKRFASGETASMIDLVFRGCKFSLYLLSIIAIPLWVACEEVLKLWLDTVSPQTIAFLRLALIMALIDSMASPITTAIQATGKIKIFQILISIIMVGSLPAAWLYMKIHPDPYAVMYVAIGCSVLALATRFYLMYKLIIFNFYPHLVSLSRDFIIIFISGITSFYIFSIFSPRLFYLFLFSTISITISIVLIFLFGITQTEKRFLIRSILHRRFLK